jgi:hypothetical protein
MRASFSDPQGPRFWRFAPYIAPLLLILTAIFGPPTGATAGWLALAGIAGAMLAGLVPMRQTRARPVDLVCAPGYVEVKGALTRNQRIRTKSIVGASTCRTRRGVSLALAHAGRTQPMTIEVESEADAERIRRALAIGHGGFGTLAWRTTPGGTAKAAFVGRWMALGLGAAIALLAATAGEEAATAFGLILGQFAFIGAILGVVGWFARPPAPTVVMAADGLRVFTSRGWFNLPYANVLDVEIQSGKLVFRVPPPYHTVSVDAAGAWGTAAPGRDDLEALVAQIRSASLRARGLGPQKQDVTGRLDTLRRNGESARDWLVRLDMAGQLLSTAPGYRGNTLDTEDLWAILEDPEAEAELRAAAARILRHSPQPDTRTRIDAAVAAIRDDATHRRLRIAIADDLDEASIELTTLDHDVRYAARMPQPR